MSASSVNRQKQTNQLTKVKAKCKATVTAAHWSAATSGAARLGPPKLVSLNPSDEDLSPKVKKIPAAIDATLPPLPVASVSSTN